MRFLGAKRHGRALDSARNDKIADHAFRTAGYFSLFTFHYSLFPSIPPLGPKEV